MVIVGMMNNVILSLTGLDPVLIKLVYIAVSVVLVGFVMKLIKQPYIIAYIIVGVCLGQHGLGIFTDDELIGSLGNLGLILLLFFIGMEISLPQLISNWRVSVLGTIVQVLISVGAVWVLGYFMEWKINRIVMLGFVISLSSTAVVIKLLQDKKQLTSKVGQNVLGILLVQDVLIVPMFIVLNYLNGDVPATGEIIKQLIGGGLLVGAIIWMLKSDQIKFPFDKKIKSDHELQVFIAFAFCFGLAIVTSLLGLSAALGAFVAGIFISTARATSWVHESLHSLRVMFVALFFVSVGLLIDLPFIENHWGTIMILVFIVFLSNNLINAIVMRLFGETWKSSFYAGAILAQIGEFSFVLGMTGYQMGVITDYTYQLIISIISISLILSPFWISIAGKYFDQSESKN